MDTLPRAFDSEGEHRPPKQLKSVGKMGVNFCAYIPLEFGELRFAKGDALAASCRQDGRDTTHDCLTYNRSSQAAAITVW